MDEMARWHIYVMINLLRIQGLIQVLASDQANDADTER